MFEDIPRLPVRTKRDFVERYSRGEFGNCSPTWSDLNSFLQSDYSGAVHIRNRVAGGPTWYNVPAKRLGLTWRNICQETDPDTLYISAMAPHEHTVLQGEVIQSVDYLSLTYTTSKLPMRDAFAVETKLAGGIMAVCLLRNALNPNSYDWLTSLLRLYPDHVIEFSAFSVEWGTVPGYNTCFWEVRKDY